MNKGFFLKLAIAIVLGFGLFIAGYHVYEPIQFTYYKMRLMSDDPETVKSAVSAVAAKGKRAIPKIREWLGSESDKLAIGACKVLENMSGKDWEELLPEIRANLRRMPDDCSDAAAALLISKGINEQELSELIYNRHWNEKEPLPESIIGKKWIIEISENQAETCGILSYTLKHSKDDQKRAAAAYALGYNSPLRAKKRLIEAFTTESSARVRACAAEAIEEMKNPKLFDLLYEALENETDGAAYNFILRALGESDSERAYPILFDCFKNPKFGESEMHVFSKFAFATNPRSAAIYGMKEHDGKRTLPLLIESLQNDSEIDIRRAIPRLIVNIEGPGALKIFLETLKTENDAYIRVDIIRYFAEFGLENDSATLIAAVSGDPTLDFSIYACVNSKSVYMDSPSWAGLALSRFPGVDIDDALETAMERGNPGAWVALGIRNGGEYLTKPWSNPGNPNDTHPKEFIEAFLIYPEAKWGNENAVLKLISSIDNYSWLAPQYCGIFDTMPDEFPKFDLKWSNEEKYKWERQIKEWGKENKSRLAWDAEKRKYYLKPESVDK